MFAPASPLQRWWSGGTRGPAPALASALAVGCCICALHVGTVRGGLGCCCTSWRRRSNPWLAISALSPGADALRQSLASLAPVSTFRISLMEAVLWVWLYLYFALMVRWAMLISVPHDCCAAHSTLAKMTTVFRSCGQVFHTLAFWPRLLQIFRR